MRATCSTRVVVWRPPLRLKRRRRRSPRPAGHTSRAKAQRTRSLGCGARSSRTGAASTVQARGQLQRPRAIGCPELLGPQAGNSASARIPRPPKALRLPFAGCGSAGRLQSHRVTRTSPTRLAGAMLLLRRPSAAPRAGALPVARACVFPVVPVVLPSLSPPSPSLVSQPLEPLPVPKRGWERGTSWAVPWTATAGLSTTTRRTEMGQGAGSP